jgi:hypothetical protein
MIRTRRTRRRPKSRGLGDWIQFMFGIYIIYLIANHLL